MRFFSKNHEVGQEGERGFAILFAVLTASVLLSIGISIFNLTVKELTLSASGRESQFAFYAADTGAECALYWDFKGTNVFATSSASNSSNAIPTNPDCVDAVGTPQYINIAPSSSNFNSAATQFNLTIPNTVNGNSAPYCAIVTITKTTNNSITSTQVDSRGYNTCVTTSPSRVERALQITY